MIKVKKKTKIHESKWVSLHTEKETLGLDCFELLHKALRKTNVRDMFKKFPMTFSYLSIFQ